MSTKLLLPMLLAAALTSSAQTEGLTTEQFTSAENCRSCHPDIYQQWRASFHSQAATDSFFWQMFTRAVQDEESRVSTTCLTCHTPVATVGREVSWPASLASIPNMSLVASEGVTCDFCHTISGSEFVGKHISLGAYRVPHAGATRIKYGIHPEAVTDAHDTLDTQFLKDPSFCSICHKVTHPVSGAVQQDTYAEWYDSPYRAQNRTCQDCHMPQYSGQGAVEGPERDDLKAHVFPGGHSQMLQNAATVTLWAQIRQGQEQTQVDLTALVTNTGSGHLMPTGMPGIRELWLDLRVTTPSGTVVFEDRLDYGITLVDVNGNPTMPWKAVRVEKDTRIAPQKSRKASVHFELPAHDPEVLEVSGTLNYRLISERAARLAGMDPSIPIEIARDRVTINPDGSVKKNPLH